MEGKDNIKDLFSQKLGNYEAPVNPELWAKISSQVAAGATTTAATGISMFTKVAIGIGISAAAITTVVVLSSSPNEIVSEEPSKEVQRETPTSNTINEKDQVADLTEEKELNLKGFRDVRKYLGIPSSVNGSAETSVSSESRNPETASTGDTDFQITGIPTRNAETISSGQTSEPTIVEGITYGDMTNYGSAPANTSDSNLEETAEVKVEPIKRYVNTFTPNGDGRNDYFKLESEGLTDFSVVVFNPNGDIVFQSNDPTFSWDGRDIRTGEMVKSGTYMYMVSAYDSEGNPFPIYERLTINR